MEKQNPSTGNHPLAGKILMWLMAALILGSVGVTFWRIVIKKDYIIESQTDCDPTIEKCFIYTCDPQTETTCTGNPDDDIWYYQKVRRNANKIPVCDSGDENCQEFVCDEGEKECNVSFCTEETKSEEDVCSDPVQYNLENQEEEEIIECEEGDEECLAGEEEGDVEIVCDPESEDCPEDVTSVDDGAAGVIEQE